MMQIQGYPTVGFVQAGKVTLYKGPRKAQDIAQFASQQATAARLKAAVSGVASGVVNGAKQAASKLGLSKLVGPGAGAGGGADVRPRTARHCCTIFQSGQ